MVRKIPVFCGLLAVALVASVALADITISLGRQPENFGSQSQAQALLSLIEGSPGQSNYQINYTTSIDTVVFGCDLTRDALVRIHQNPNGTGTGERWQGHALYRLKSAGQGGSLNDTPSGKVPGIFQKF
jgi:hypothetical protein